MENASHAELEEEYAIRLLASRILEDENAATIQKSCLRIIFKPKKQRMLVGVETRSIKHRDGDAKKIQATRPSML